MRGLTARLIASYLLLAALVLGGAGALSYRVLAVYFTNADKFLAEAQVEAAINWAMYKNEQDVMKPEALVAQVEAIYPMVRATYSAGMKPDELDFLKMANEKMQIGAGSDPTMLKKAMAKVPQAVRLPKIPAVAFEDSAGNLYGIIRFEPPTSTTGTASLLRTLVGTLVLALAAAAVMAFLFSRTLTAPLKRFVQATERMAAGEWDTPLPASGLPEIQALSGALRRMAGHLAAEFRQLRQDREALQNLTAEVAHEIKTPIASLKTYHEQLLDGAQEDPESREEFLRRGARQVERLQYLAEFMVDMARLRAHTAQVDRRETDFAEAARLAVEAITPAAQGAHVAVKLLQDGPLPVLAGRHRLGQVMDNLLTNAVRHSPAGGTVTVTAAAQDGQAVVTVADEGAGIAPSLLPRLFEPFVRGAGSSGMGLGLAIVAAIMQSYGGSVSADNLPDGGAIFTAKMPLREG